MDPGSGGPSGRRSPPERCPHRAPVNTHRGPAQPPGDGLSAVPLRTAGSVPRGRRKLPRAACSGGPACFRCGGRN